MTINDLFAETRREQQDIPLKDGELTLWTNFLDNEAADEAFDYLKTSLNWEQPSIAIMGKTIPIPRLQAWHGENGQSYTYSRTTFQAAPWNPWLSKIKNAIEEQTQKRFNSVLCNLYRDGNDSVGWHADNEQELGLEPIVGSFSLGAQRKFQLRHKADKDLKLTIELPHNSLLLMGKGIQNNWVHQVPKERKVERERLNLTFRYVYES